MKISRVKKRDGRVVDFDESRISRAIAKANDAVGGGRWPAADLTAVVKSVKNVLKGMKGTEIDVEAIQDIVERQLMAADMFEVAKAYIVYRSEHNKARKARQTSNAKAMSDLVFIDKYTRHLPDKQRRETFDEVMSRVKGMHLGRVKEWVGDNQEKAKKLEGMINWAFDRVRERKVLPAMRSLQFGGQAILANHLRMYNCTATFIDRVRVFQEVLYALLCGCGVGYSVEFEHVEKLPPLADVIDERKVVHYRVPDTIEGWADALGELVKAYIQGYYVEFSYANIRPRGSQLKTSGGRAPGHIGLKKSLERIRLVLDGALGRKLKPIECHDILCHASDAVLSGGVRRSAMIAVFSSDDSDMINAKTGDWFRDNPQRARSNNSVRLLLDECTQTQFDRVFRKTKEFGEPGIVFSEDHWTVYNPCCEIAMQPYLGDRDEDPQTGFGVCNLTEINGKMAMTEPAFMEAARAAAIIGTVQAGYDQFPYMGPVTEEIVRRDALIGVSITGIMDNPSILLNPELQRKAAEMVNLTNQEVAELMGINQAARTTCVKPAGSTSIVLDTASGIHPRHARRYFRRVQYNKDSPVYQHFKKINPHMCEPSKWSANTTDDVVTFCVEAPSTAIVKRDLTALDQLEHVLTTQKNWIHEGAVMTEFGNNVSNTVSVGKDEWDEVADFLWNHKGLLTGVSFIADDGDRRYEQAPFQEVATDEDDITWNYMCSKHLPVEYGQLKEEGDTTSARDTVACSGGVCELKI